MNRNAASAPGITVTLEVAELDRIVRALAHAERDHRGGLPAEDSLVRYLKAKRERKAGQLARAREAAGRRKALTKGKAGTPC